jgi:hypothetical protein
MTDTLATPINAHAWQREVHEHYVEPAWCSKRLFEEEGFEGAVYDPCCGFGTIVKEALKHGLAAYGSDLVDRGWDSTRTPHDFLASPMAESHQNIVCNPPFNIVPQFAAAALARSTRKVALIFPTARLNAAHWLRGTPLARVWLMTPRPSMPPGHTITAGEKPGGGKMDFCWLVWTKGRVGPASLQWLRRDA